MRTDKRTESETIDKSLEMDIEKNVHELRQAGVTFLQPDDGDDEMVANNLASLLRRVSEVSTREIENLIGELRVLREKLEIDYDRLQNDFADYAELSQVVMQLTTIISDSVNSLPSPPDNGRIPYAPRPGR